jgi:hypothetical protein
MEGFAFPVQDILPCFEQFLCIAGLFALLFLTNPCPEWISYLREDPKETKSLLGY